MSFKRKMRGGVVGLAGFLLSPLSWWNDLVINVPLAVAFAWVVSLVWPGVFAATAIVGYWLTNILGLFLMQKGAGMAMAGKDPARPYGRRDLVRDVLVSLLYTGLIVLLLKLKILQPVAHYFHSR